MSDQDDRLEEIKALAHEDMRRDIREVEAGKGGLLHRLFQRASKAQNTLDRDRDSEFVLPEMEEVYASYLPEILRMAAERGVSLKDETQMMREQLIREADAGDRVAQYRLASAYESGEFGLERDAEKAFEYMVKAAENGSLTAIRAINFMIITAEANMRRGERPSPLHAMLRQTPNPELNRRIVEYRDRFVELATRYDVPVITREEFATNPNAGGEPDDLDDEWQFIPDYTLPEL